MKVTCTGCGGDGCQECGGTGEMKLCFYDAAILQQEDMLDKLNDLTNRVNDVLNKCNDILEALP